VPADSDIIKHLQALWRAARFGGFAAQLGGEVGGETVADERPARAAAVVRRLFGVDDRGVMQPLACWPTTGATYQRSGLGSDCT
jgi:hypothetical protein